MALDLSKVATGVIRSLAGKKEQGNVVFRRYPASVTDNLAGTVTPGVPADTPVNAAVTSVRKALIDGSRIKQSDTMVTIDNLYEPDESDICIIKGVEYVIQAIIPTDHAGTVQIFEVIARA